MMGFYRWLFAAFMVLAASPSWADDPCAHLDALYPQPGRLGAGENTYRPLPLFTAQHAAPGAAGTLSLSIAVDHVSTAPLGKPGVVWVGNYPVTDIPVFRLRGGASGNAQIVDPATGRMVPIANACLAAPSWGFGGSQWALTQGDTLDILFQSRLDYAGKDSVPRPTNGAVPCRASNLHTHGLLVSPYHPERAGLGPYGDYVMDATQPHGSTDFGSYSDNCGTALGDIARHGHGLTDKPLHYETFIPGTPHVNSLASGEHPSGLFWYHPHPHGYSQFQDHGGTTGVITIGDLTDYACPAGSGSPGQCTLNNTSIRVMALKDTPIQQVNGQFVTIHDGESDLCTPTGGLRRGECQGSDALPRSKWVFTVNGVQFPVIHTAAGQMEIWRIVNTSPSMTYRLSINKYGKPGAASLPFEVLAKDGVAIRQNHADAAMHTQILMMPASRVEIAIPAPVGGGTFVLHNSPAETAANGRGDVWPAVDLAQITWGKSNESRAQAPAAPFDVAGPATPVPHGNATMEGVPARCRYDAGDTRVIYFVHRFVKVYVEGGASVNSKISPQINEVFGLIAGLRHPNGVMDFYPDGPGKPLHHVEDVWHAGIKGIDTAFPGLGHNDYNTICTVQGNVEHWELQNWTAENHNFHLHQSKFTIDPDGVFQFPAFRAGEDDNLRATDAAVRAFVNRHEVSYNDTVPVPRGQSICATAPDTVGCHGRTTTECQGIPGDPACGTPGKMSVLIDFSRAEQVGSFVYHCHILEHEDGGMMARINVLCPPGDTQCAAQQLAHAPICRPAATE